LSLGVAGTVLLGRRRSPPTRDDRLVQAVDEMRTRMDTLGRDLSDALERAERESKRNRFLSDLGSSIEFDELLDRVLDAALEVPGFDAAMVTLEESGGQPAMATRGMTPEEAAHPPSSGAGGALPPGPITVRRRPCIKGNSLPSIIIPPVSSPAPKPTGRGRVTSVMRRTFRATTSFNSMLILDTVSAAITATSPLGFSI